MARIKTVDIITMGCSKNLVDSERLIKMFERAGYTAHHNPSEVKSQIVVINTCGFIGDAKQESIDMILECCQAKEQGAVKKVYVMGCLSQRYAQELPESIPEVDGWFGKFDWKGILGEINDETASPQWERTLTTPPHYTYLKIAEGCNRFCAFCAIPLITGRYKSRPIEEIVEETRELVGKGVREFNVIAQDLTYYGLDLYGKQRIADLVDAIAQVEGVKWIRLHYAYPTQFPYDLLPVMARHKNVCRYMDIALQHISDKVLENMRRHITGAETRELLRRMRAEVPGIHIRTTLMVGFPGEGEKEYQELIDFVKEQRFERMGAFAYCEEDDTYAAKHFADDIPAEVKERRLSHLMEIQEEISLEHNQEKIGLTVPVVIDSKNEEYYVGRTEWDSPEVDNEVLVSIANTPKLEIGKVYDIELIEAMPFELIGKLKENV
ncbi:MAG: 30S ribosomal protein S12 methylthiotransferase RimO [Bacteroidales bacterium]|nr:30S ribosomal protein S12 methylthiotransferase RimO [Bacteroidales bacterium]